MIRNLYHNLKYRLKPVQQGVSDDDLAAARIWHEADIERLADLDGEQLHYLGNIDQVEDPKSDGIDCGGV